MLAWYAVSVYLSDTSWCSIKTTTRRIRQTTLRNIRGTPVLWR